MPSNQLLWNMAMHRTRGAYQYIDDAAEEETDDAAGEERKRHHELLQAALASTYKVMEQQVKFEARTL